MSVLRRVTVLRGVASLSALRRVTGLGSAGSLALALLAGGCVLAATAGPRQAQATGARALQQTMNQVTPLDRTIVVGSSWARVDAADESATGNIAAFTLTRADVGDVTTQLRRDFGAGPLRLTPEPTDWLGMNPGPSIAASAVAAAACAVALPRLVAPAIDLSVFTHSAAPVPLRPDFAPFVLPLAALLAVTVIALVYEIRISAAGPAAAIRRG